MALIVVGGQTKNVGKTTLICNIVSAFPQVKWTAVKISNHAHSPQHCDKLKQGSGWTIWQQSPTTEHGDTARFLRAGADRGLLVQADNQSLKEACAALKQEFASATAVIVESASAAEFLQHDLLLVLLDAEENDFKSSARQQLDRADAFVLRNSDGAVEESIIPGAEVPILTGFPNHLDPRLVVMLAATLGMQV
jgi:hypothetical protein